MSALTDKDPWVQGDESQLELIITDAFFDPTIEVDQETAIDLTGYTVSLLCWWADAVTGEFVEYASTAEAEAAAFELQPFVHAPQAGDTLGRTRRDFAVDDFAQTGKLKGAIKVVHTASGKVYRSHKPFHKNVEAASL